MATIYKSPIYKETILELYQQKLDSFQVPYGEQQVMTFAGQTNVVVLGEAHLPPLVLIHGINVSAPIALEAVQELSQSYRIYGVDVVGQPNKSSETRLSVHDDSYGRWLEEVLDGLQLDKVPVIGVSYGGFIVQRLLQHASQRVERAILIVPAGFVNGSGFKSLLNVFLPMMKYWRSKSDKDLLKFMNAFYLEVDDYSLAYQKAVMQGIHMDMARPPLLRKKDVQNLEVPIYIIAAEKDIFFPGEALIKKAKKLFKNLVQAELLMGEKHVPDPRVYPRLNQLIRDFLS